MVNWNPCAKCVLQERYKTSFNPKFRRTNSKITNLVDIVLLDIAQRPHGSQRSSIDPAGDAHAVLAPVGVIETMVQDTLPYSGATYARLKPSIGRVEGIYASFSARGTVTRRVVARGCGGGAVPLVLVHAGVVVLFAHPAHLEANKMLSLQDFTHAFLFHDMECIEYENRLFRLKGLKDPNNGTDEKCHTKLFRIYLLKKCLAKLLLI